MIVRDIYDIAPNVRCVRLRTEDRSLVDYKPGQYINLRFYVDGRQYLRSYSIATVPRSMKTDEVELCIALVPGGVGSEFIRSLRPDDTVETIGPVGLFTLRKEEHQTLVLVATGTGIVPFRSMRRQLREMIERKGHTVHLVYGCRSEEDFVYDAEWRALAMQCDGFHYHPCASQAEDPFAHRRDGGINGRVQAGLEALDLRPSATAFYLCGVPQMIEDVEGKLLSLGVSPQDIVTELYISPEYETTSAA